MFVGVRTRLASAASELFTFCETAGICKEGKKMLFHFQRSLCFYESFFLLCHPILNIFDISPWESHITSMLYNFLHNENMLGRVFLMNAC